MQNASELAVEKAQPLAEMVMKDYIKMSWVHIELYHLWF